MSQETDAGSLARRLREAREEAGLSQREVARQLGIAPSTVSRWERGEARPRSDALPRLAEVLGVSVEWLAGEGSGPVHPNWKRIPILGVIRAGSPSYAEEDIVGWVQTLAETKADFALIVHGNSMVPELFDGDMIFVQAIHGGPDELVNRIVVALVDGEVTVKRLARGASGHLVLRATNPAYPDIPCDERTILQGRVVEVRRRMAEPFQIDRAMWSLGNLKIEDLLALLLGLRQYGNGNQKGE